MANEITINSTIRLDKGGSDYTFPSDGSPFTIDMTGTNYLMNRQIIGFAAEEALLLGDVDISANGAWFCAVNRDATNFVEIRTGTGVADLIKIRPGEPCGPILFTTTATAPFAIADTANCELEYILIEA
jgi:hypothetical protein